MFVFFYLIVRFTLIYSTNKLIKFINIIFFCSFSSFFSLLIIYTSKLFTCKTPSENIWAFIIYTANHISMKLLEHRANFPPPFSSCFFLPFAFFYLNRRCFRVYESVFVSVYECTRWWWQWRCTLYLATTYTTHTHTLTCSIIGGKDMWGGEKKRWRERHMLPVHACLQKGHIFALQNGIELARNGRRRRNPQKRCLIRNAHAHHHNSKYQ